MKNWTDEMMEELYQQIQEKAATDKEFREALLKDANAAIEQLTGEKLPDGCMIKAIEQDPDYTATFVIPDYVGEELSADEIDSVSGAISWAVVLTVCAAAVSTAVCAGDVCAAKGCVSDVLCAGQVCASQGKTL